MSRRVDEELLRRQLAERLALSGLSLDAVLADPALVNRGDEQGAPLEAIVVLCALDWPALIRGAIAFAHALDEPLGRRWLTQFTRARFLAGSPARLSARCAFDRQAPDGSIGWIRPAAGDAQLAIKRLLKTLRTSGEPPALPPTIVIPAAARPRRRLRLRMATAGLSLEQYLIHLHHTVCEAALAGHLAADAGDELLLTHVEHIAELDDEPLYLRVHHDGAPTPRLRLYAALERHDHV